MVASRLISNAMLSYKKCKLYGLITTIFDLILNSESENLKKLYDTT